MKWNCAIFVAILSIFFSFSIPPERGSFSASAHTETVVDSIVAYVYRAGTNNIGFYCSTKSTGVPVGGLKISLRNADTGQLIDDAITNANGRFALMAPTVGTYISLEPCLKNDFDIVDPAYNGLSAIDIGIIRNHINKDNDTTLYCPLLRISADFQYDGKLDNQDLAYIQEFVTGSNAQDYPHNPWRLIPNIHTFPTSIHPDANFTSSYWTLAYPDASENGSYYPFDARLILPGRKLRYQGSNHWQDTVKRWQYTPSIHDCGEADYGFWVIKAGDVDGSASLTLNDNCFGGSLSGLDPLPSMNTEEEQRTQNKQNGPEASLSSAGLQSLLTGESYRLHVKLNAQQPTDVYQMGLKIDTSWLEIEQIEPVVALAQDVDKEFNTQVEELAGGNVRMLWFDHQNVISVGALQWLDIAQIKVKAKRTIQSPSDLEGAVSLDSDLLPSIFVSGIRPIPSNQLEIKFEFEAL
ncbi:MAG: carboxypeptidase-like regulatory domain-containing protein [Bacteroidota bacterium]